MAASEGQGSPLIEEAAVGMAYTILSGHERGREETKRLEEMGPKRASGNKAKQYWMAACCPAASISHRIGI